MRSCGRRPPPESSTRPLRSASAISSSIATSRRARPRGRADDERRRRSLPAKPTESARGVLLQQSRPLRRGTRSRASAASGYMRARPASKRRIDALVQACLSISSISSRARRRCSFQCLADHADRRHLGLASSPRRRSRIGDAGFSAGMRGIAGRGRAASRISCAPRRRGGSAARRGLRGRCALRVRVGALLPLRLFGDAALAVLRAVMVL